MSKEIIGYILKENYKQYEKIAMDIAECQGDIRDLQRFLLKEYWGEMLNKLKKAGVLELWFEPIYKEEFKVGDWVCFDGGAVKSAPCRIKYIYEDGNGVGEDDTYKELSCGKYRLATKQEIEQHLIAEAKKRGFGKGIKWINPIYENYEFASKGNFTSEFYGDNIIYLYLDHNTIYNKGEWAEIIKDEEIEISGYKAKFDKARKTVQFGCKTITLEELKAVLVVMELNKKFDYRFSISNNVICTIGEWHKYGEIRNCVTKETIQKLIKILEDE